MMNPASHGGPEHENTAGPEEAARESDARSEALAPVFPLTPETSGSAASPADAPGRQIQEPGALPLSVAEVHGDAPIHSVAPMNGGGGPVATESPPPAAVPGPVKPVRDSDAMTSARCELWRLLQFVRAELVEARSAGASCSRNKPLGKFLARLQDMERDLGLLHATCYANTLGERDDALRPLLVSAYEAARLAGVIKLGGSP